MIYTAHLRSSFGCELYSKSALLLILSMSFLISFPQFRNIPPHGQYHTSPIFFHFPFAA